MSAKVVVVTGASAGVGRAVVRRFAADGARIGLLARGTEGLEVARHEVESAGGRGLAISVDVADADEVEAAAGRIEEELGPIDVWINNAMVTVYAEFLDVDPAEFWRALEVTYLGTVWGRDLRSGAWFPAIVGSSSRSARRSPTVASLSRRPTWERSTLRRGSPRACGLSSCTGAATFG